MVWSDTQDKSVEKTLIFFVEEGIDSKYFLYYYWTAIYM